MEIPGSIWAPTVFKTIDFPKTNIECGSICLQAQPNSDLSEKLCHGFKHKQGSCYLFNLEDSPRNLITNHEEQDVYLNMEFLSFKLADLYQFHDLIGFDYWHEKITQVKQLSVPYVSLDCMNHCSFVRTDECEFYVLDNSTGNCYTGMLSSSGEITPDPELTDAPLFVLKTAMNTKMSQERTVRNAVEFSKLMGYIYTVNETIVDLLQCSGECYFHKTDPCHFSVFHDNVCYLGDFDNTETNEDVFDLGVNVDMYFNRETMGDFSFPGWIEVNANYYQLFGIKQYSDTVNADHCKIHCILENDCHASTFNPDNGICQLASFHADGSGYGHFGVRSTFIKPDLVTASALNLYFEFTSPNSVWPKKIFKVWTDIEKEEHCAAICGVIEPICNLYFYDEDKLECNLGAFSRTGESVVPTSDGSTSLKWRKSKRKEFPSYSF